MAVTVAIREALPQGLSGIRLRKDDAVRGVLEVEMTSIGKLAHSGQVVNIVGIVDEVLDFMEGTEEREARLRLKLVSSARDSCAVALYGDLAWSCQSMGRGTTMALAGKRAACGEVWVGGSRDVAGCVDDEVLVSVDAALVRLANPSWPQEMAQRSVRNRLAAMRKQRQRTGRWPSAPVAVLAMRSDRCWRCGDAWSKSRRCASWPVCGGQSFGQLVPHAEPAVALEACNGFSHFRVRTLPSPRGELSQLQPGKEDLAHPLEQLHTVARALEARATRGKLRGVRMIPESILRTVSRWREVERSRTSTTDELMAKIPAKLRDKLLPFQREGVRFALSKQRSLIADEMGLGKTLQAIAFAAALRDDHWPLMVLCPAGLRAVWADQVETWLGVPPTKLVVVKTQADAPAPPPAQSPTIVIVSFTMLERLPELSREVFRFPSVIVDEAQHLQTATSKILKRVAPKESTQTCVACSVATKATYVCCLSGTPALIRPVSAFALFDMALAAGCNVRRHWLRSRDPYERRLDFARYWAGARKRRLKGWQGGVAYDAIGFHDELHVVLKELFMIRRFKRDVLSQLPPLTRNVVRLLDDDYLTKRTTDLDHRVAAGTNFPTSGSAKVNAAAAWIVRRLAKTQCVNTKLVVFAHHVVVIDALDAALERARRDPALRSGLEEHDEDDSNLEAVSRAAAEKTARVWFGRPAERIDGATSMASRERVTRDFRNLVDLRVVLVSITAGGVGIDLSRATEAVFVESVGLAASWLRQAEDRLHRRGQRRAVTIFYLLGPRGSWDNKNWPALDAELGANSSVFNGGDKIEQFVVESIMNDAATGTVASAVAMLPSSQVSVPEVDEEDVALEASWRWTRDDDSDEAEHSRLLKSNRELLFAVSRHTGRVHVLAPVHCGDSFSFDELWAVVETGRRRGPAAARAAARRRLPEAVWCDGQRARLASLFARDWETLSSRQRATLLDQAVVPPLADAVARLNAAHARDHIATRRRHVERLEAVATTAHYHEACEVRYVHRGQLPAIARYVCIADQSAKCLVCENFYQCSADALRNGASVADASDAGYRRKNIADLFCSPACRESYMATTSAAGLRSVVFARDAGVCANCGTDGHRLVERLLALRHADYGRRYRLALEFNPKWAAYTELLARLLDAPRDGLAWEADHVRRVADGGGRATADQVQTLCVPCHRDKTRRENTRKRPRRDGLPPTPDTHMRRDFVFAPPPASPAAAQKPTDDVLFSDEEAAAELCCHLERPQLPASTTSSNRRCPLSSRYQQPRSQCLEAAALCLIENTGIHNDMDETYFLS